MSEPYGPLCGSAQCADRCMLSPGRFGCPALSPPHPMTEPAVSIHEMSFADALQKCVMDTPLPERLRPPYRR